MKATTKLGTLAQLAASPHGRQWMRIPEFAEYLDCSQRLVERLVHEGVLPVARVGRCVRIDVAAAEQVLMAEGLDQ